MSNSQQLFGLQMMALILVSVCHPQDVRAAPGEIEPTDVFFLVASVRDELNIVHREMAKPTNDRRPLNIKNAEPREVFFQALTLCRKANRLSFQVTRKTVPQPRVPKDTIRPRDVYAVVDVALDRVRHVRKYLGAKNDMAPPTRRDVKTPTDVFQSIVQANRHLNLLLDEEFAPSDVFQQVTLSVSYMSVLRAQFPGRRMPQTPSFEGGKTPPDVYRQLLANFEVTRRIAKASGVSVLQFEVTESDIRLATPSDVYDLASLITSELQYLHSRLPNAKAPYETYYPGPSKTPSDVFQRVGLLNRQLTELDSLVRNKPHWLRAR